MPEPHDTYDSDFHIRARHKYGNDGSDNHERAQDTHQHIREKIEKFIESLPGVEGQYADKGMQQR